MIKETVFQNILELKKQFQKNLYKFYHVKIAADANSKRGHLRRLNNDLYLYDKKETIILPFQLDLKFIQKLFQNIKPICQIKWGSA